MHHWWKKMGLGGMRIKTKLVLLCIVVTNIALLLFGAFMMVSESFRYRQSYADLLAAQAKIVAANSASAIKLGDKQTVQEILNGLSATANVARAAIYKSDGTIFATYVRDADRADVPFPMTRQAANKKGFRSLELFQRIEHGTKGAADIVGTIYIQSDLRGLRESLNDYLFFVVTNFIIVATIAYLIFSHVQQSITAPILTLAVLMEKVSLERDYGLRIDIERGDEIGDLAHGFNDMLHQIAVRDGELERHRNNLEKLVNERTKQLAQVNEALEHELAEKKNTEAKLTHYANELEHMNDELRNFVYIFYHDLRTPVVTINGFLRELSHYSSEIRELVERYKGEPEVAAKRLREIVADDIPESIEFIQKAAVKIDRMIDSVIKLTRLSRINFSYEPLDVARVVDGALDLVADDICRKGVSVEKALRVTQVVADEVALTEVFTNIIQNAVRYLLPDRIGHLSISSEPMDGGTLFCFGDNGRGISPESVERMFDFFQRGDNVDVDGEGMGLVYAKTLIKRMDGTIRYAAAEGGGSLFYVWLPDRTEHS